MLSLVSSRRLTGEKICSAARMARLPAVSLIWSVALALLVVPRIPTTSSSPVACPFLSLMKEVSTLVGDLSARANNHLDDMEVFGRQRGNQAAPEIVTHPLLLDGNGADRTNGQGRPGRRARNSNALSAALGGTQSQDILAAIENVIGEPTIQLFSSLLARRPGADGTIRLDVAPGAFDRHGIVPLPRRGASAAALASMRVRGQALSSGDQRPDSGGFDPLVTLNRWTEEVKILNGKFMNERAARVANHVILRLLPEAIERAEQEAKAAEQERERQREEEERVRQEAEAQAREEQAAAEKAEARLLRPGPPKRKLVWRLTA